MKKENLEREEGMVQKNNITRTLQITRSTLLTTLCSRSSKKNATIPESESLPLQDQDPLSPTITCFGQVKRKNKITNLPMNSTAINSNNNKRNHYCKLKHLFSGKSHTITSNPNSPGRRRTSLESVTNSKGSNKIDESNNGFVADLVDMDPPLPVVKRKPGGGEKAAENLWKRRSGGLELRSLQIQQVQFNKTTHHQRCS